MPTLTRKTRLALAVSSTLVLVAGLLATAAVFNLPFFGFGGTGQAAEMKTIEQIVYDDHYVTPPTVREKAASDGGASSTKTEPPASPTTVVSPPAAPAPALAVVSSPATAATTAPPTATTTRATATTAVIPPPPAGCHEPEWDREHRVWQCSNGGDD